MFIKRPGKERSSYALVDAQGKTVKDVRIEEVNADLARGIARDILEARMQGILRTYKPKAPKHDLANDNEKLAHRALAAAIRRSPDMAYTKGRELRLIAAARYMGSVIVQVASEEALITRLGQCPSPARRFEYTARINEMLACIGRKPLPNKRPRRPEPKYILVKEFKAKASKLSPEVRLYLGALFATGCRMAELPEVRVSDVGARIDVEYQWHTRRLCIWPTKNKKGRTAPTLPALRVYLMELKNLPQERQRYLCTAGYKKLRRECRRVLGCRVHDLRHSYCVELASKGFGAESIARYIGDTVAVVLNHYRNWLATDEEFKLALKKLG